MYVCMCFHVLRELYFGRDQNFYRIFNAKIQSTIFLEVRFSRRVLATNRLALFYIWRRYSFQEIFFRREVCFSVATTIRRRAISGLSMTKMCTWFDIVFFRRFIHTYSAAWFKFQTESRATCILYSHLMLRSCPGCYASYRIRRRDAPETQSYLYFLGKKSIYL